MLTRAAAAGSAGRRTRRPVRSRDVLDEDESDEFGDDDDDEEEDYDESEPEYSRPVRRGAGGSSSRNQDKYGRGALVVSSRGRRAMPQKPRSEQQLMHPVAVSASDSSAEGHPSVHSVRHHDCVHLICCTLCSMLRGLASKMMNQASSVQEMGVGRAMVLKKLVKGRTSSQFERFMLQLTWPDDSAVDPTFTQVGESCHLTE